MKKLLFLLLIPPLVTAYSTAHAQENTCNLDPQYKTLSDILQKQPVFPSADDTKKELGARVALLEGSIGCSQAEAQDIKTAVQKIDDSVGGTAKTRTLQSIDEALQFLSQKQASLKDQGIQGTKDMAREILGWRNNSYQNILSRSKNLLIWSGNQTLFDKANDRLSQSQLFISGLKLLDSQDAQDLYNEAKAKFAVASDTNNKAKDALANWLPPEITMGYIKSSLDSLAKVYKSFLGIGDQLNVALPSAPADTTSTPATAPAK